MQRYLGILVLLAAGCGGKTSDPGNTGLQAPTSLVASSSSSSEITLAWSAVAGATGYDLYWSNEANVTLQSGTAIRDVSSPFVHSALTNGLQHHYVVTAKSDAGQSEASAPAVAMPLAAPADLTVTRATGALLDWSPVLGAEAYTVYWSTTPGSSGTAIAGVQPPYAHTGIDDAAAYYYYVTATNTLGGGAESSPSDEVEAVGFEAPANLAVGAGTSELTLSWDPVPGAVSYDLYWSLSAGVDEATRTRIANVTSPHTHAGLTNGTFYFYVVTATDGAGTESPESNEVFAAPIAAPAGVQASAGGSDITVTWNPVPSASFYNLYWATASGVDKQSGTLVASVSSPYVHESVTGGTTYYYVVTAGNSQGESSESAEVSAAPFGAPQGVRARAGDEEVTVAWSPVGGATSYNLYWSTSAGVTPATGTLISSVTSPYVHTGRTNGVTYYYIVTAMAGTVESSASAEVAATPIGTPASLEAVGGTGRATLTWDLVPGAVSYNLYWATSPGVSSITGALVEDVSPPFVQTELSNGAAHYWVVTAVGPAGEGSDSPEAFVVPLAEPQSVTAVATTGQAEITWDAVPSATSYNLYWSTLPGVTPATGALIADVSSPYVHSPLANDDTFHWVVTAVSNQGGGSQSDPSSQALAAPIAAPTGVEAMAGPGQITVRWDSVSGATSYNLYWSETTGVTQETGTAVVGATSPFVHTGRTPGAMLFYVVTALNDIGLGAESNDSLQALAVPPIAAPEDVIAWSAAGGEVTLSWSPVDGADIYNIYSSTTPGVTAATGAKSADVTSPHTLPATNGVTRYFVVTAEHAAAGGLESPESAEVSAQPLARPGCVRAVPRDGAVLVELDPPTSGTVESYDLYWGTSPGVTTASGNMVPGVASPYLHTGRSNGQAYYYVATATNSIGGGAQSIASLERELSHATPNQAGIPDLTLGDDGLAQFASPAGAAGVAGGFGSAVDSSGRILVTGYSGNWPGDWGHNNMTLWRLTDAGELDTDFSSDGWLALDGVSGSAYEYEYGSDVTVDGSGRILVTGWVTNGPYMGLWRFNSDGTLDNTFSSNGSLSYADASGASVLVDGSDRILVVGSGNSSSELRIWRFEEDGTPDATFGTDGVVAHSGTADSAAEGGGSLVLDSSGRILVAGYVWDSDDHMAVWRFNADGTLDTTFGTDGAFVWDNGGNDDFGRDLLLDGSGRILIAGVSGNALALWRLTSAGALDTTFNSQGWVTSSPVSETHEVAALGIDGAGRIVVAGTISTATDSVMALWGYDSSGSPDPSFGVDGVAIHLGRYGTCDVGENVEGFDLAIDGQGRAVVTGRMGDVATHRLTVWRYE